MKILPPAAGAVCLLFSVSTPGFFAQEVMPDSYTVTRHQLQHNPPREARRLFKDATVKIKQKKFESGLKLLERALAIDAQFWGAENNLGYTYLKVGQAQKAVAAFQQAINIDPHNVAAYSNLGVSALIVGDFKLAELSARRALQIDPRSLQAKGVLGLGEIGQGHWTSEAYRLLNDASAVLPDAKTLIGHWGQPEESRPHIVVTESSDLPDPQL